jgi:hypothetical protein
MSKIRCDEPQHPLIEKYRERFEGRDAGEPLPFADARELFGAFVKLHRRLIRITHISDRYQGEVKRLVLELQEALANVKTLKGFLPICASCKKIRNDDGYWKSLEHYMAEHSDVLFSHGLCPDCVSKYRSLVLKSHKPDCQAPKDPQQMVEDADLDDPVIVRFLPVLNNEHFAATPLYTEFLSLFQHYVRLTRRIKRIARISDHYQGQLKHLEEAEQRLTEPPQPDPRG